MRLRPGRQKTAGVLLSASALCVIAAVAGCVSGTARVQRGPKPAPTAAESPAQTETTRLRLPGMLGPVAGPGEVTELVPGGEVDWSGQTVSARGTGLLDPGATEKERALSAAERAATVVARRNLLEILKGIPADPDVTVGGLPKGDAVLRDRIERLIKEAQPAGPTKYDSTAGTVTVELQVPLYNGGLADALVQEPPQTVSDSPSVAVRRFLERNSSLVLDGTGTGLKPSLFPRVYDSKGAVLLDTRMYVGFFNADTGGIRFVNSLEALSKRNPAGPPLVVSVQETCGALGTGMILDAQNSNRLKSLKEDFGYLVTTGRILFRVSPK